MDKRPHHCKAYVINCKDCSKELTFDEYHISESGKHIPLSKASGKIHRCKEKPFNKDTRKQWWQQQEAKAWGERERNRRIAEEEEAKERNYYEDRARQRRQEAAEEDREITVL
jgi:hypothetical protein